MGNQTTLSAAPQSFCSAPNEWDDDPWDEDDVVIQLKIGNYKQWTSSDGRIFVPAARTVRRLTPGAYEVNVEPNIGLYFEKIPIKCEGLVRFPDTNSDRVLAEIQKFWDQEAMFDRFGIAYQRGVLLYGPPGSGKTCTIQLIMQDVVERKGVVIRFEEPHMFLDGMRVLRQVQPDVPVVAIMEDLDSILEHHHESEVLNILDGVNAVRKIVYLATTNYPDKLGPRIVNRPSRFDKRFRIGYPNPDSRRMYFEHLVGGKDKLKELKIDLKRWVKDTDGFSVAHLKELFIGVVILGDSYDESLQTLKNMRETLEDKDYDTEMGFAITKSQDYYS